jgi:hypothetical protein
LQRGAFDHVQPDAVVDECGDIASVSPFDQLDVAEGAAAQLRHAGAGAVPCLQAGGELGEHLAAGLLIISACSS